MFAPPAPMRSNSQIGMHQQQMLLQEPSPEVLAQQMNEAVQSIAAEEKADYLEAQERAPHLVATESSPSKFFRYCQGDVWSMAQRICCYWKERKQIFQERAFLPLDLTGRGALTPIDILCLTGGIPAMLPRTRTGQQVMLIDRRQLTPISNTLNRQRCFFYLAKKLAEDPRAQTEGVLMITLLVLPKLMGFDRSHVKRISYLIANALPIKVKIRLICQLPKSGKYYVVQKMIAASVRSITSHMKMENILDIHIEQDQEKLTQQLLNAGLFKEGIPDCLGGNWRVTQAFEWCQRQAQEERDQQWLCDLNSRRQTATRRNRMNDSSGSESEGHQATAVAAAARTASPRLQDGSRSEDSKQQQPPLRNEKERKAANVIYSRRKRQRRKEEEILLRQEHEEATEENVKLKAEHERLQMLLKLAQSVIQQHHQQPLQAQSSVFQPQVPQLSTILQQQVQKQSVLLQQQPPQQAPLTPLLPLPSFQVEPASNGLAENNFSANNNVSTQNPFPQNQFDRNQRVGAIAESPQSPAFSNAVHDLSQNPFSMPMPMQAQSMPMQAQSTLQFPQQAKAMAVQQQQQQQQQLLPKQQQQQQIRKPTNSSSDKFSNGAMGWDDESASRASVLTGIYSTGLGREALGPDMDDQSVNSSHWPIMASASSLIEQAEPDYSRGHEQHEPQFGFETSVTSSRRPSSSHHHVSASFPVAGKRGDVSEWCWNSHQLA